MLTQHPRASGEAGTLCTFPADPFDRSLTGSLHPGCRDAVEDSAVQAATGRLPGLAERLAPAEGRHPLAVSVGHGRAIVHIATHHAVQIAAIGVSKQR